MRILRKAICFSLIFLGLFLALDQIFYDKSNTSQVWEMIQDPKSKDIDILFMGNSHAFTAINPVIINESLNINSTMLGSPSQPMELTYSNLKVLLRYKKPKAIVLEANVLNGDVDTICKQGKEGFLYNNIDAVRNPVYRAKMVIEILDSSRWLEGFSQLFRPMLVWKRLDNLINPIESYNNKSFGNVLGFFPKDHVFSHDKLQEEIVELERKNIADAEKVTDNRFIAEKYKEHLTYLHKFLDLTDRENIPVYIIKNPAIFGSFVGLMKEVEKVSRQHKSVKGVYNYNMKMTQMGLLLEDFYDRGHLNRIGAVKLTTYLTDRIGSKLHKHPDYSKVSYYKNESMEKQEGNLFRYKIETFPNSLVKFIVYDNKNRKVKETSFSEKQFIDMERIGYKNKLFFSIQPLHTYENTIPVQQMEFKFIKDKGALQNFEVKNLGINVHENRIEIRNNFKEIPVFYTYVVYQNGRKIKELPYSSESLFRYEFKYPGKYRILAYIKTKDKNFDISSLPVSVNVSKQVHELVAKVQ